MKSPFVGKIKKMTITILKVHEVRKMRKKIRMGGERESSSHMVRNSMSFFASSGLVVGLLSSHTLVHDGNVT